MAPKEKNTRATSTRSASAKAANSIAENLKAANSKAANLKARKPRANLEKQLRRKLQKLQQENKAEHKKLISNIEKVLNSKNTAQLAALRLEDLQNEWGLTPEEAKDIEMEIDGDEYYNPSNSSGYSGESGENGYNQSEVEETAAEDGSVQENPTTGNPATGNPTTGNLTMGNPTTDNPTTGNPTTGNPTTGNPTTGNLTTGNPTTDNPTTGNPTTGNPTTGNPTTGNLTTGNPTTGNPTTGNLTTGNPTTGVMPSIEPADTNGGLELFPQSKLARDNADFKGGSEYGRPLGIVPSAYYRKGEEVRTVGWSGPPRCRQYVNMYGKKSAAQYRIEKYAYPPSYGHCPPSEQNVAISNNRSFRYPNGKNTFIFGVAWRSKIRSSLEDDLKLISPHHHHSFKHTVTRVLVGWESNGQGPKKWETRGTFRDLVGDKANADMAIWEAAVEAHENYIEVKEGRRRAISKSPDAALAEVDRPQDGWGEARTGRWSSTPEPNFTPSPRSTLSPEPSREDRNQRMKSYVRAWLDLAGFLTFADLNEAQQQKCTNSWLIQESMLQTGAA